MCGWQHVGVTLLRHGRSTLPQLHAQAKRQAGLESVRRHHTRSTRLSPLEEPCQPSLLTLRETSNALLVLIHHQLVRYTDAASLTRHSAFPAGARIDYEASMEHVLFRLRHPAVLRHVFQDTEQSTLV